MVVLVKQKKRISAPRIRTEKEKRRRTGLALREGRRKKRVHSKTTTKWADLKEGETGKRQIKWGFAHDIGSRSDQARSRSGKGGRPVRMRRVQIVKKRKLT